MSETYIQNYGMTKTIIKDPIRNINNKQITKWIGDYDGDNANIQVSTSNNGDTKNYNIQLNNDDILDLLGVQAINIPLEQRLQQDFLDYNNTHLNYQPTNNPTILEGLIDYNYSNKKYNRKNKKTKKNLKYSKHHSSKSHSSKRHSSKRLSLSKF